MTMCNLLANSYSQPVVFLNMILMSDSNHDNNYYSDSSCVVPNNYRTIYKLFTNVFLLVSQKSLFILQYITIHIFAYLHRAVKKVGIFVNI